MKNVFDKVKSVASTKTTVLIAGETGTGKGVIAKLIHQHSHRRDGPFIAVHCGAIAENLLESELFGHEKGSFTGAIRRKLGKFEIAQNGTIFLDEIGTMSYSAQIKLLQVLQDKIFQRVGGEEAVQSDVRIIAASNVDLNLLSSEGKFRKDLFYRLNVFPIEIPSLRGRLEDIPLMVNTFLERLNKYHLKDIQGVHEEVLEAFERYSWPGNIRELENLVERAYILETSSILTPESFPNEIMTFAAHETPVPFDISSTLAQTRARGISSIERQYLKELLAETKGNIGATAKGAGITPRQLHKLMVKHSLRKEEFKVNSKIKK
jgi:transcriptional regulator with GAF, ATPase, and Fis domain